MELFWSQVTNEMVEGKKMEKKSTAENQLENPGLPYGAL